MTYQLNQVIMIKVQTTKNLWTKGSGENKKANSGQLTKGPAAGPSHNDVLNKTSLKFEESKLDDASTSINNYINTLLQSHQASFT